MKHLKSNWGYYLLLVIILILVAYQMQLFGNKTKLFRGGGRIGGVGFGGGLSAFQIQSFGGHGYTGWNCCEIRDTSTGRCIRVSNADPCVTRDI